MSRQNRTDEMDLNYLPNRSNHSDSYLLEQSSEPVRDAEDSSSRPTRHGFAPVKDHGYAWVICAAAFLDLFIVLGIHYSFGVLYAALLDHFGESISDTAWVGSIGQFSLFFFCYTSSILSEKFGCRPVVMVGGLLTSVGLLLSSFMIDIRWIYVTHGFLFGLGTSMSYLPALVMVGQYFDENRCFATGIAASGSNLGALSLAPLQQIIVNNYGWRNCYRALAGLTLLIAVCGAMFRPFPKDEVSSQLTSESCNSIKASKREKGLKFPRNPRFIVWAIASTIAVFGYFIPHTNLVHCAEKMGYSNRQGSLLLSYVGVSSGVGKVFFGKLSDASFVNIFLLYIICMVLLGLTAIVVLLATSYHMLIVYSSLFGLLDGSFIGLMSIVTFECADPRYMSQAWGGVLMIESFAMLLGPPAAGWFADATGDYRNVFYFSGGPMILGALLFSLVWCVKDPKLKNKQHQNRVVSIPDLCGEFVTYERLTVV